MNKLLRITTLFMTILALYQTIHAGALKASISGKIFDWSKSPSSSTTRYGISFKNKSNEDLFLVVENQSARTNEAKFGSIRYFASKNRSVFATTPVFKAGSAKQGQKGQYWEGVNLEININQPTTLSLYSYNRNMPAVDLPNTENIIINNVKELQNVHFPFERLVYHATFTPGKTIYVKWDGKKLMPQDGNIAGKSDGGFNLKNNVTAQDIITIR